ncbi:hypothetical protein [Williamsia limnetica]|nr:hypothetical protein [Williamsia limnetica]
MVSPSGPVDLDELRRLAEMIPGGPDYILDQNVHHHSWGADATVVEFVVQAAASGVIGSIGWEALKSFARAVTGGRKSEPPRPLEESEARGWAEQMAVRRFPDLVLDDLVVRRVELREPNATVTLGCRDGSTVTVELEIQDGLIALGAVARDYPSP